MTQKKKRNYWFRDDSRVTMLTPPEAEIMRVVWDRSEPVTVREVYEAIRKNRPVAYTTVMSVMNKLARKEVLVQDTSAAAYRYTAAVSDIEVASDVLDAVVEKILAGAVEPLISRLLGSKNHLTEEQLKRLEELLQDNE